MSGRRRLRGLLQRGTAIFLMLLITVFAMYSGFAGANAFAIDGENAAIDKAETKTETREAQSVEEANGEATAVKPVIATEGETTVNELGTVEVEGVDEKSEEALEKLEESGGQILFSSATPPSATKKVKLTYNKKFKYEGYHTMNYKVTVDGKSFPAYCVQPSKKAPGKKEHNAKLYDKPLMMKALYYSYGYPGYTEKTKAYLAKLGLKKCYQGNNGNYTFCHILLSYIYDGCKDGGDAFKGVTAPSQKKVKKFLAQVKKWPDPVDNSGVSLSATSVNAQWNEHEQIQETPYIKLNAHPSNYITVKVPKGTTMMKKGEPNMYEEATAVKVKGGEEFSFNAPSSVKGVYKSPVMAGVKTGFNSYIIQVNNRQDIVLGVSKKDSVSFKVKWVELGNLQLLKTPVDSSKTEEGAYYTLEGAEYGLYKKNEKGEQEKFTTVVVDEQGRGSVNDIPYGEYTLEETDAPRGFLIDEKTHKVTVNADVCKVQVTEEAATVEIKTVAETDETETTVKDNVMYSGVHPGEKYLLKGILMDKGTGESTEIEGTSEFIAGKSSGQEQVDFNIDRKDLAGKKLVAYEYLYHMDGNTGENTLLASHEDINDSNQTVEISKLPAEKSPQTGDESVPVMISMLALIAVATGGIIVILVSGRRKKNER